MAWPALDLLDCDAGSGHLLGMMVGDLRSRTLVSPKMDSDSLELVDCMADPRKTYGEMAWLWGSAVTYGEMAWL